MILFFQFVLDFCVFLWYFYEEFKIFSRNTPLNDYLGKEIGFFQLRLIYAVLNHISIEIFEFCSIG